MPARTTRPMLAYRRREQFPDFLAERIRVTGILARYACYYGFVFKPGPINCYVTGAAVQYGTGSSTSSTDAQGRRTYHGLEASHTRLGTYTVEGAPVSWAWPNRIIELATGQVRDWAIRRKPTGDIKLTGDDFVILKTKGPSRKGVIDLSRQLLKHQEKFPANCEMASVAMMHDARTDYTDALLNQVFGTLEGRTHLAMRTMTPSQVPADPDELLRDLGRLNARMPHALAKALWYFSQERLRQLDADPSKERRQHAADGTVMFAGERDLLTAIIAELKTPGSATWSMIEHTSKLAKTDTREEVAIAVQGRNEVIAVN